MEKKQINAVWLPHKFDKQGKPIRWYCSNCKSVSDGGAYCPHCKTKMKGDE